MKINGIAHIVLTVNRPELALPFYERLFGFLELKTVFRHERGAYFIGGKTAVAIVPAEAPHDQAAFVQTRIGLHHLCFRAYSREDVDRLHAHLCEMGAKIVHPPEDGPWAPGYYSVLFEDPDGIRLEVNHVPGKGLLTDEARFNPVGYDVEFEARAPRSRTKCGRNSASGTKRTWTCAPQMSAFDPKRKYVATSLLHHYGCTDRYPVIEICDVLVPHPETAG